MNRDTPYLEDILGEIDKIRRFTAEGREEFLNSEMAQYAVIHAIQIIGEAAKRVSDEVKIMAPAESGRELRACGTSWSMTTPVSNST